MAKKGTRARRADVNQRPPGSNALKASQIMERAEANWAKHQEKIASRPKAFQKGDFELPDQVADFLANFFQYPAVEHPNGQSVIVDMHRLHRWAWDAYMEGCRQGYVEGFVVRGEPDRKRSLAGNEAKNKMPVRVGSQTMTKAERNAKMAAEFHELVKLMKPTPAMQRLAEKYGFESWQGVAYAIGHRPKARK